MKAVTIFFVSVLLASHTMANSSSESAYVCGMAEGFYPYQYSEGGEPRGLDYAAFQAIVSEMDLPITVKVSDWDSVVAELRFGKLDCAIGMEWDQTRGKYFDFSPPFYHRRSAVFVLADNSEIQSLNDLNKKSIVGDRHSYYDNYLKENDIFVRNKQSMSKEESIVLLQENRFQAMIAPLQVGKYLAEKHRVSIRVLSISPAGTPVSMVVKKGNKALLTKIEAALLKVKEQGKIDAIYGH